MPREQCLRCHKVETSSLFWNLERALVLKQLSDRNFRKCIHEMMHLTPRRNVFRRKLGFKARRTCDRKHCHDDWNNLWCTDDRPLSVYVECWGICVFDWQQASVSSHPPYPCQQRTVSVQLPEYCRRRRPPCCSCHAIWHSVGRTIGPSNNRQRYETQFSGMSELTAMRDHFNIHSAIKLELLCSANASKYPFIDI